MNDKYRIMGYYSKEDGLYIVFAPDLPGCFADGETIRTAKENIAVIIKEWIEYARELGRKIPEPLSNLNTSKSSIFDVAEYILQKRGEISTMMLEKLTYYCQAWSLGWFHTPLFPQKFQAWEHGPVCRELYERHKGRYVVSSGDIENKKYELSDTEKRLIDDVLSVYGDQDPEWLSDLSHSEMPWKETRGNLSSTARSCKVISTTLIEEYYSGIA